MISLFRNIALDILNLVYPNLCAACNTSLVKSEKLICTNCLFDLPRTNFHTQKNNKVEELFWGRINVEQATSFYFFNKGSKFQNIIHKLKYRNLKEIGFELGKHFGTDLLDSDYKNADMIIPIPLHKHKYRKRGYNQSEWIALGMSVSLNIPVKTGLVVRDKHTDTQTHKTRFERWENVHDIFAVVKPKSLESKHIILVDDVITTGATMEACARKILEVPGAKISLASLALA